MSVDRFRFVSPGIFINEIDQSQVPRRPVGRPGPAIIGRAARGPAFRPVQINSFDEFVQTFGDPSPGLGAADGDVWRDGVQASPTYGAYAAQAYLANSSPVTFVRLLGTESPQKTEAGKAGWDVTKAYGFGVYGLMIFDSGSTPEAAQDTQGCLAAVWYVTSSYSIALSGNVVCNAGEWGAASGPVTASVNTLIETVGSNNEFKIVISDGTTVVKESAFNFNKNSGRYIRNVFNTNPLLLNPNLTTDNNIERYFLGESYDRFVQDKGGYGTSAKWGILMGLGSGSTAKAGGFRMGYKKPETPTIIAQWPNPDDTANFDINGTGVTELFSVAARDEAEWLQNNIKISITDIKASPNPLYYSYGTFTLMVRSMTDSDETPVILEQWNGLSLDPKSANYIAKRVGDKFVEFDSANKRFREYGQYENLSRYVRMKMNPAVDTSGIAADSLPFGFKGIPKYKGVQLHSGSNGISSYGGDEPQGVDASAANVLGGTTEFGSFAYDDSFTILVPTAAGGYSGDITVTVIVKNGTAATPGAKEIHWDGSGGGPHRPNMILAINGTVDTAKVKFGADLTSGTTEGILGLTATEGASDTITLTADNDGTGGNDIAVAVAGSPTVDFVDAAQLTDGKLAGGSDDAPASLLTSPFMSYDGDITYQPLMAAGVPQGFISEQSASAAWPMLSLRLSSSDGLLIDGTDAFWGLQTTTSPTATTFDGTIKDLVKVRPETQLDGWLSQQINSTRAGDDFVERGPGFSLDNLVFVSDPVGTAVYSGSNNSYVQSNPGGGYKSGTSMTAVSSSYAEVLNQGFDRFTVPMVGGFDGLNVKEKEPFNNTRVLGGVTSPASDGATNAMYYSLITAIDSLADPEFVEMNLAAVPGIWQRNVTNRLLRVCQDRADAMAVIDLEGDYLPSTENTDAFQDRVGSVARAVSNIKNRALNNSYGAAYYPWVQINDNMQGARVWVPPSVVALGVYASAEARSDVWFAPAGFNRGGLSDGAAGLPVLGVVEKLTSKQRDSLYEVNINPIATFPAEGIVIFGQKTLQATASALDRINVRRLLIYLKRRISRIAATILFDPNVQVTWNRFLSQVEPLLRSVKSRFGLAEYRVILDGTTTTPDMIDRNIMYAKVFLKPTRAIEFIALDFIITRTGASFDD